MAEDEDSFGLDLLREPDDYRPATPKQKKHQQYTLQDGTVLDLELLAQDALWSNYIWNAGRVLAQYFEHNPSLIQNKSILELGAGVALPSLVAALKGASTVVVTDYPDAEVIANLAANIDRHRGLLSRSEISDPGSDDAVHGERGGSAQTSVHVRGLLWGSSDATREVLGLLQNAESALSTATSSTPTVQKRTDSGGGGFDVLVLADLLFNHSEHKKMMATVAATLKKDREARAYVFFTPYRPWLLDKDLAFFELAGEVGLVAEKSFDTVMQGPMDEFKNDRGDEKLRCTVFGYELRWSDDQLP